jgi:hypothetical protein
MPRAYKMTAMWAGHRSLLLWVSIPATFMAVVIVQTRAQPAADANMIATLVDRHLLPRPPESAPTLRGEPGRPPTGPMNLLLRTLW